MVERWANRAVGALDAPIGAGDLSLTLGVGEGAEFPVLAAGDWFGVVIETGILYSPSAYEIVRCTARSGDVLTIVRAQQGTSALAFAAGARVSNRITAETLEEQLRDLIFEDEPSKRHLGPTSYIGCGASSTSLVGHWWGGSGSVATTGVMASTNQLTSQYRTFETVAAVEATVFGVRGAAGDSVLRGNAPGIGGFRFEGKIGLPNNNNNTRLFVGLVDSPAAFLLTAGDASGQGTIEMFGFGFDVGSTTGDNLILFHCDGAGVVTSVDTGIPRAECVAELLYFLIRADANGSGIRLVLQTLVTGTLFDQVIATNIPPATIALQWQYSIRGSGVANTIQLHYVAGVGHHRGY